MKLYRSITIDNIPFSLDDHHKDLWNSCELSDKSEKPWWANKNRQRILDAFVSELLVSRWNEFLANSAKHSAYKGGRFNPEKSYSAIYCSNSPETAILEVCFHKIEENYRQIRRLSKLSNWSRNTLGEPLPSDIEFKVIVIEMDINGKEFNFLKLNESAQAKSILKKMGYNRYLNDQRKNSFIEFILSNDYSICRQIAAIAFEKGCSGILYPSARVEKSNNFVIFSDHGKIKKTNNYALCDVINGCIT